MAEATRRRTVYQIRQILKAYKSKLEEALTYRDCLSAEGKELTDDYMSKDSETRRLIEKAVNEPGFFLDLEDDALIRYSDVCIKLNRLLRLKVSGVEKIKKIVDTNFFITSDAQRITSLAEVELGRTVTYNVGESARIDANDILNQWLYDVEWEIEDMGGNFDEATTKRKRRILKVMSTMKNAATDWPIISLLSDENPFEMQLKLTSLGEYKIRAKIYKDFGFKKYLYDVVEFDQLVTNGDDAIMSMKFQQKILKALELTNWKVDLDFAALSRALFLATGVIIVIAAIAVFAPEVAAAIMAVMTIGMGIDAAINIIKGILQLAEALQLIEKARSERALQIGGEKLKEGILNIGVGIIQLLLKKLTMKNLAEARVQILKNVTPKPAALPQPSLPAASDTLSATAKRASQLPALSTSSEELSVILNKSAVNAMENIAEMSILQSEKVALQEMVATNKLSGNKQVSQIKNLSVKGPKYNSCPDTNPYAKNAVEIIEVHNQFVWNEPEAKWLSSDGKRKIWFENVWKYEGENGIVEEFTVLEKYSMKNSYKTSTIGNKSFMQAHHGIQSDWATKHLLGYYNEEKAPALLLRDSCKGTPHEYITNSQKHRSRNISYFEERNNLKRDLKNLNVSETIRNNYLKKTDDYFYSIYEQMQKDSVKDLDEIFDFDFKTHTQLSKEKAK